MEVTKLDAARRQLETAIVLYFNEGDPVSIHTLACAAYDVLRALNREADGAPMMKDWLPEMVEPEMVDEFRRFLNMGQNFFKHADRDHHAVLDFKPAHSEVLMLDACWAYRRIAGERLPVFATFEVWAGMTFARTFVVYPGTDELNPDFVRRISSLPKGSFFAEMLPAAHQVQLHRPDA